MSLSPSELILNADGSIYHLGLLPGDLAETVITVGDPKRVEKVSALFDRIEIKKEKREFLTHSGTLGGKRLSVISTGIGTDNIDIVLNEIDALANIDLQRAEQKAVKQTLDIIRIGSSGAIQPHIPINSFLLSEMALGFDGLLHYYDSLSLRDLHLEQAWQAHLSSRYPTPLPYAAYCDNTLAKLLYIQIVYDRA